jgi:hypothetical protein
MMTTKNSFALPCSVSFASFFGSSSGYEFRSSSGYELQVLSSSGYEVQVFSSSGHQPEICSLEFCTAAQIWSRNRPTGLDPS